MSRFEDQVKDNLTAKNPFKAAISISETIVILGLWVLVSRLTLFYIIKPISFTHPQKFVWEMNFATYILIFTCLLPLSCLFLWRGFVQKINALSIINSIGKFRLENFFLGFGISALIVIGLSSITEPDMVSKIIVRFLSLGFVNSLILLLFYIVGFSIQSTFEEALFRASFVQNLRALGIHIIISIPFSAFFFAMFHMSKQMPSAIFFATFLMAITFSYATWRTQGLETSMGAHIANNIIVGAIFGSLDNSQSANTAIFAALLYTIFFVSLIEIYIHFKRPKIS